MLLNQDPKDPLYVEAFKEIRDYILYNLGYGLVTIEMIDEMLNTAIIEAIQTFADHYQFNYKVDIVNNIQGSVAEIPEGVDAKHIKDVIFQFDTIGLSTQGGILTQSLQIGGVAYVVPYNENFLNNFNITSYYQYLSQLEDMKRIMGIEYDWQILNGKIQLYPNQNSWERIGVYSADLPNLDEWGNEVWVRQYSLARAKVILGTIRSKFTGLNLSGGALQGDGAELKAEGKEEIVQLKEQLKMEYGTVMPFLQT